MDGNYLNGLGEYLRRSGRNLAELPGQLSENLSELPSRAGNALAGVANSIPHIPIAQTGIQSYDGALTGTDLPYYGDDEISAARAYFDRQPRSNTSRLIDIIGSYMSGAATGPKVLQAAGRVMPTKAPQPNQSDEIRAIMDDLRRGMAEAKEIGVP
jgi:hypothetical protein